MCQTMANMWAKKSDGSAFTLQDFLLTFIDEDKTDGRDGAASAYAPDVGFDSPFDDTDLLAAKENAVRMARLVVEMNKALGGEDRRTPEKRTTLEHMSRETS